MPYEEAIMKFKKVAQAIHYIEPLIPLISEDEASKLITSIWEELKQDGTL